MKSEIIVGKYALESLTTGMYSNAKDIFREYIQNSVDSIDEAISAGIINPNSTWIKININPYDRVIIFEDNGIGIPSSLAYTVLTSIGNSSKSINTSRGFRGIGRLSGLSYCNKLRFETSFSGQSTKSTITFDAHRLKEMLKPGSNIEYDMATVISEVTCVSFDEETEYRHYFKVILEEVENVDDLLQFNEIVNFLEQTAPIPYNSKEFSWGRRIHKMLKSNNCPLDEYKIFVSDENDKIQLLKPFSNRFIADKFKRIVDEIADVETFEVRDNDGDVLAVVWYSISNYFGSILSDSKKGLRFRKGNILVGDHTTLNNIFKESRFNGWFQGEVIITSPKIVPNARRDNFEKNLEFKLLIGELVKLGTNLSKKVRAASAERNKKLNNQNTRINIIKERASFAKTSATLENSEMDEIFNDANITHFETDSNLSLFKDLKKFVYFDAKTTKYNALNSMSNLTGEQKNLLEKVFDVVSESYEKEIADSFINSILSQIKV